MNKIRNIIIILTLSFICFAGDFIKLESQDSITNIKFDLGEVKYDSDKKRLTSNYNEDQAPPESIYSFLYNYNGDIEVNIQSSELEIVDHDIILFDELPPLIDVNEYGIMRGTKIFSISINPLQIENGKMVLYNQIYLSINELEGLNNNLITERNYSKVFENLLNNFTINGSRDIDLEFQEPAILYITGGNSGNLNSFNALVDWRQKQGYTVYTASIDEIGSSISEIKNYIDNAYYTFDPSPEFVCLIGDIGGYYDINTYYENLSGYDGEGDHPFTQIEGDDILPEIIIGRLSVRNSTHLSTVVNKIFNYEKAVYTDEEWFDRAALVGDPDYSGYSVIITNEYIKETLQNQGAEDIRTNFDGGNEANWMITQLNDGVGYLNYRGYYGVSGFTNTHIENLNNGPMLPFATIITCGTGSFADPNESAMSEVFLRAGSTAFTRGAVAAIGTATIGTHTAYNNILDMGVYYGIFTGGANTTGEALASGKLALLETYPQDPFNKVTIFTHWNNLMGDPAIPLWTKSPKEFTVSHPDFISPGSQNFYISVLDEDNLEVNNARITVIDEYGNTLVNDITDEYGNIQLIFDYVGVGPLYLTITGKNKIPYESQIEVHDDIAAIIIESESISVQDDYYGNGNSIINPGESALLFIPIKNMALIETGELYCNLSSNHNEIEIYQNEHNHMSILAGELNYLGPFEFNVGYNLINNENIPFNLNIENQFGNLWSLGFSLTAQAHFLSLFDEDNNLNPFILTSDQSHNIELDYINIGLESISDVNIQIEGNIVGVSVSNNFTDILEFLPNQIISGNPLTLHVSSSILNGTQIMLPITFSTELGYEQLDYLHIQIGEEQVSDPLGPDQYGYYIFGSEDIGFEIAPEYNWIEIDPYYGGNGTNLELVDYGDGEPAFTNTAVVSLPFTFSFYGINYDEVTISADGWIAFGETDLASFRNYPIPGPGGPSPMIAAFWDDLKTINPDCEEGYVSDCSGDGDCCPSNWIGDGYSDCEDQAWGCDLTCYDNDGGDCDGDIIQIGDGYHHNNQIISNREEDGGVVLTYHDITTNNFIIEWSDMRTYDQNDDEDFQIILIPHDGDGDILIQYKTFNNTSVGEYGTYTPTHGQYATIGIENLTQDDGLQYTFNNIYPLTAGIITDESAILITPNFDEYINQILGDLNYDLQLNVADVVLFVGIILETIQYSEGIEIVGDMNYDNEMNITDIVILVNIILDSM